MRSRPLAVLVALAAAVGIVLPIGATASAAPAAAAPLAQGVAVDRDTAGELAAVFDAINAFRATEDLPPLRFMPALHTVAQSWSYELGQTDQFKHRTDFASRYPAGSTRSGEIIAWRSDMRAAELVTQWINSPAHKAHLLGDYTAMGIGVAEVRDYRGSSRTALIGTVNFGKYVGSAQPTTYANVQEWVRAGGRVASPPPAPLQTTFDRIPARDTMQASVELSASSSDATQVSEVYLAPSHVFFEALTAAPAAARNDRALLLVDPAGPSSAVLAELRRLNPATVTAVGTASVLSEASLSAVRSALPAAQVTRVAGRDVAEISANFARQEFPGARSAYMAAERNLSDATSGASSAAVSGVPLVLTPRVNTMPDAVRSYFAQARLSELVIVGGAPTLAKAHQDQVRAASSGTAVQLVRGADRFRTNAATLQTAWSGAQSTVYLASGLRFGHAAIGSAVATGVGPVVLTSIGCVPPAPHSFASAVDPDRVVALGREWTVSDNAAMLGRCAR
ncbi:cell wall-binding repeat-containing protein [Agrococcus carbonis]|uniref:Uncharacterized conserved protein YkwD, contains CAP (CSP/antigen 5/PR1) domain n=1 Tax=Agrococcus carbonis TaxID=684552 RepID=A0A1H1N0I0_9MICO|nr:cell wall-binding repeat-containing protein [Agrococcus carbonis]SDR91689.1 Uncharacterized conserved protein YkwD, contains CAP (CSP/antigen 5/PR1) domain [Agrococcus carbonis]